VRVPKSLARVAGHHRLHDRDLARDGGDGALPDALSGASLRRGLVRVLTFAGVVIVLIVAVPGLGSIRGRLAHGSPGWLVLAGCLRLASVLSYVVLFRAVFAPRMPLRMSYRIGMSEVGANALAPAGGASGLAVGDWVGAAGLFATGGSPLLSLVPALAATFAIGASLALIPRLPRLEATQRHQRRRSWRWWLLELAVALGTGARGAVNLFRERNLAAIGSGAGYLLFDVLTLWIAVRAFGGHIAFQRLALAYLVGQLAGEIPLPGGLGAVDGGLIGALVAYGLSSTIAVASSLAYRAIALGIPMLFGGLAAISLAHSLRAKKTDRPASGAVATSLSWGDSLSQPADR
jgi:uncharacterized membrane protein YbhN (UPF0104 family)